MINGAGIKKILRSLLKLFCYGCNQLPLEERLLQLELRRHSVSGSCECAGTIRAASLHFRQFKHALT
jgi:hypothetical protein